MLRVVLLIVSLSLVSPSTAFLNIALVGSFSLPETISNSNNNCNSNNNYNSNHNHNKRYQNKCFGSNFYQQRSRGNNNNGDGSVSLSLKMAAEGGGGGATSTSSSTSSSSSTTSTATTTTTTTSTSSATHQQKGPVWQRLSECFRGDFDNYAQVLEDRKQNLEPREGGGHEHFHCTLVPLTESTRLAAFYFDGNPDRIFRFRYYELVPAPNDSNDNDTNNDSNDNNNDSNDNDNDNEAVEMYLNTLHPDLERLLKSHATDPLCWPDVFENFQPAVRGEPKVTVLQQCEISWSREIDPVQHSYLADNNDNDNDNDNDDSLHAVMIHGPTVVDSTIVPGMRIRIVDQLSLYRDVFYINDRGFDPVTGAFIYGNQREVPYRLERVSTIRKDGGGDGDGDGGGGGGALLQRRVVNPDLEWTIGPDFRTAEEYDRKLRAIGGPSVKTNKRNIYKSDGDGDGDGPAGK